MTTIRIGDFGPPEILEGRVMIGGGTNEDFLICKSHEVLIAALPNKDGEIASIRVRPNGEVLVNEQLVGTNQEIFDGLKRAIYALISTDCELFKCACGYQSYYPRGKLSSYGMECPRCKNGTVRAVCSDEPSGVVELPSDLLSAAYRKPTLREARCPYCRERRTVRVDGNSLTCQTCNRSWTPVGPEDPGHPQ